MSLRTRPILRQLHLWLGLSLGTLFVLLGITGSTLVFYIAIDEALHPEVREAAAGPAPDWSSPAWDRALATARDRWTAPGGTWSFEATGEAGAIPARYYPLSGHGGHHAEREMVWFSADGSRVLRVDPWGGYLMSWLYELHMHLLAGEIGSQIVGWSGFAILLLLISGIVVWWPRGSWRKALVFKRAAPSIRRLRDIHKLSGLWSMVLLFVLAGTGALLALPDIKGQLLTGLIAAPDKVPSSKSASAAGPQIPIAVALAAAHRALPDARLAFIDVPGAGDGVFKLRVRVPGDPHQRFPASFMFVDQHSGRVLAIHDIRRGNISTTLSAWIRVLHDGSVGGMTTRILAILLGFVPALLFATGLLHWRRRITARAKIHSTGSIS